MDVHHVWILHLLPAKQSLSMPSPDFVNCFSLAVVPSTIMCVVLLRQLLCTSVSLQRREIHAFSETVFNCSQNPLVGFFNVNVDFCMFFQTRALGQQAKIFYGVLFSLATSIFFMF